MASKHTPGPWELDGDVIRRLPDNSDRPRLIIELTVNSAIVGEAEATRNLILAAPDMLAALKAAEVALEGELESRTAAGMPEYEAEVRRPLELVRTAIAKAEAADATPK